MDNRLFAAAPGDFDVDAIGQSPGGNDAHGIVARQVTAATNHFLRLHRNSPADHFDARPDAARVRRSALEPHAETRSARVVAVDGAGIVEIVHHHVEVAVVIEVGKAHAVGHAVEIKTPGGTHVFERQIAPVAKRQVRRVLPRK